MKTNFIRTILFSLCLFLIGSLAVAQTGNFMPVASGVFAAKGALVTAQDESNLTGVAAVATGQVLTSAGTSTLPAWSASPTVTGLTTATITASGAITSASQTSTGAVQGATVVATTSATIGSGTAITKIVVYSQTITPASVATIVCAEQTFTVTGLTTADKVFYNPPATGNATSAGQVRVSATDTLAVMYCNPTAGALTPGGGTGIIVAFRS